MSVKHGEDASDALIAKLNCFAPLSNLDQRALQGLVDGRLKRFDVREDIIREGDTPICVNLIVSGWACRYKLLMDGRRQIVALFFPGDFCDLRVFILKRMDHSIAALTPTLIAEVSREAIIELTEGGSPIARALWWSSLVAEATEREWIVSLGQRTAVERIGHLLCELFIRQRAVGLTKGMACDMPLTQAELAEVCGLSTVHINRSLQELRTRGLLELKRKRLLILDFDALAQLTFFNPNYLHLDHTNVVQDMRESAVIS